MARKNVRRRGTSTGVGVTRWFRPRLLWLEDRTVPSGTTIITHGYSLIEFNGVLIPDPVGPLGWMHQMGSAIAGRIPTGATQLDYEFSSGKLFYAGSGGSLGTNPVPAGFMASAGEEYIVHTDWEAASNNAVPGWAEAVAEGLYGTLRRYGLSDGNHPLHFIGHSFGAVVNSETIQRLGYFDGINVDQMTTLDPHDFSENINIVPFQGVDTGARLPDVQVW